MDPFRLACPHCASKIIVRNELHLGQTLPCPKCSQPISVPLSAPSAAVAPSPSVSPVLQRVNAPVINSAAMTKAGDPEWEALLASEEFLSPTTETESPLDRFLTSGESKSNVSVAQEPLVPLKTADMGTPISKTGWQSTNVAKRRQVLTLATIGITGMLLAIGCFVAFLKMVGNKPQPNLIAQSNNANATTPESSIKPIVNEPKQTQTTDDVPPPPTENNTAESDNVESRPAETEPTVSTDSPPESLVNESVPESASAQAKMAQPNATPATPVSPIDSELNEIGIPDFFGNLFPSVNSLPDAGMGHIEVPSEMDVQNDEFKQIFHPLPQKIPNWDEKSKVRFERFKSNDMDLLRCIDMFSKMTGVGITIDWQSFRVAGVDWRKSVSIDEEDKSIGELMTKVLSDQGLEWRIGPQGLPIVSATIEAMNAKLPTHWTITGLFPAEHEQPAIDALLTLCGLEGVCMANKGELVWSEQATPIEKSNLQSTLYELAEILQLGAEQPWHRPKGMMSTFQSAQWYQSSKQLDRTVGLSVIVPESRPITDALMTAAAETHLHLMVDWQSVWQHGLTPNKPTSVSVLRGRTLPQVARRYLDDYALELIPVSDDTFVLTTGNVRRKLIRILPVRLPKDAKVDDLKQRLRMLAPLGPDDFSRFRVIPVPGFDDLFFARICTPNLDQLRDLDVVSGLGWPDAN